MPLKILGFDSNVPPLNNESDSNMPPQTFEDFTQMCLPQNAKCVGAADDSFAADVLKILIKEVEKEGENL